MFPTRPGRDELVQVGELLGIDSVLLSVRPAGVVPLDNRARRVPVASDEVFPLGEIKGKRGIAVCGINRARLAAKGVHIKVGWKYSKFSLCVVLR